MVDTTTYFNLYLPEDGSNEWGGKLNYNFVKIDEILNSFDFSYENLNVIYLDKNKIDLNNGNIGLGTQRISIANNSPEVFGILQITKILSTVFDSLDLSNAISIKINSNKGCISNNNPLIITNPVDANSVPVSILINPTDNEGISLPIGSVNLLSNTLRIANAINSAASQYAFELYTSYVKGITDVFIYNSNCFASLSNSILYDKTSNELGVLSNPLNVSFSKNGNPLHFSIGPGISTPNTIRITNAIDDPLLLDIFTSLEKSSAFSNAFTNIHTHASSSVAVSLISSDNSIPIRGNDDGSINAFMNDGVFNIHPLLNGVLSGSTLNPFFVSLSESINSYVILSNKNKSPVGIDGNPIRAVIDNRIEEIFVSLSQKSFVDIDSINTDVNRGVITNDTQRLTIADDDVNLTDLNLSFQNISLLLNKIKDIYLEPDLNPLNMDNWINLYARGYTTYADDSTLIANPDSNGNPMSGDYAILNASPKRYTSDTVLKKEIQLSPLSTVKFILAISDAGSSSNVRVDCELGYMLHDTWTRIVTISSVNGNIIKLKSNYQSLVLITNPESEFIIPAGARISILISAFCPMHLYHLSTLTSVHILPVRVKTLYSQYIVISSVGNNGNMSPLGIVKYNTGDTPVYTIKPSLGFVIDRLIVNGQIISDLDAIDSSTYTYTFEPLISNSTISVTFTNSKCNITAITPIGGIISPSGVKAYSPGSTPKYTISALSGYALESIIVNSEVIPYTTNVYTFPPLYGNQTISAVFERKIKVTVIQAPGGNISPPGTSYYDYEEEPSYTFTPYAGSKLESYIIGDKVIPFISYSSEVITLPTLYNDIIITGKFSGVNIPVSISIKNGIAYGTVDITNGGKSVGEYANKSVAYPYGSKVIFYVFPKSNSNISDFIINGFSVSMVNNTYTIDSLTEPIDAEVVFLQNKYTIEVIPTSVTVNPSGIKSYNYGDKPTYTFSPPSGELIKGIQIEGKSLIPYSSNAYTFNPITEDIRFYPTTSIKTIMLTCIPGINGTIEPNGITYYSYGTNITIKIYPNSGFSIDKFTVNDTIVTPTPISGSANSFSTVIPNAIKDYTVKVTFKSVALTLTVNPPEILSSTKGSVVTASINLNGTYSVAMNDTPVLKYTISASGYLYEIKINDVSYKKATSQSGLELNHVLPQITKNTTIKSIVKGKIVFVELSMVGNGAVAPFTSSQPKIEYSYGESPIYKIMAGSDSYIFKILFNSVDVTSKSISGSLNVGSLINENNYLSVTFKKLGT